MDKSWIKLQRTHPRYKEGVKEFIKLAEQNLVDGQTQCPCNFCKTKKWLTTPEVETHLMFKGFYKKYDKWVYHGKGDVVDNIVGTSEVGNIGEDSVEPNDLGGQDDIRGMLGDAFGVHSIGSSNEIPLQNPTENPQLNSSETASKEPTSTEPHTFTSPEEEAKYKKMLELADEELYEGCTSYSKLSFILHLFHLKCMHKWSTESFTSLLDLLNGAFPQMKEFPETYYQGKKLITDLGLGYQKIDACPNNCVLYINDLASASVCPTCESPRWEKDEDTISVKPKPKGVKVLKYFPLIPRLKRIYRCSKLAKDMRWHAEGNVKDGKMRHPSDGLSWIDFNTKFPEFSTDPRSVRLGLASDGFNPYRLMNTSYSIWPVVLIPYNLPPWLCMKQPSFILSMIIPGKTSPGNDIDVFLIPLVQELKQLWDGVEAFDAHSEENFTLKAALTWTINDLPAYAILSGKSTKGYAACPICVKLTPSVRFANRICYVGYRKWLPIDHPWRSDAESFDGKEEYGLAPTAPTGTEVLREMEKVNYVYGNPKRETVKKRKRSDKEDEEEEKRPYTKRSILYDLKYWQDVLLRHNLDIMHIEARICDILIATLLGMDKTRDDEAARIALEEAGLRPHLWMKRDNKGKYMPPASFTMSTEEKERFLRVLQKLKTPDGYGASLGKCVNIKQRKLVNLKSHDHHCLMQDILPAALQASKATKIIDLLSELSAFFKYICSSTIDPEELDTWNGRIVETLCEMEKEFLPCFFTIMLHLVVHLADEVKLGGPAHYRWMYPIERYLATLKSLVTNKAQPEGSIAESYLLDETIKFCSRYFDGVETVFSRPKRNDASGGDEGNFLFNTGGKSMGKKVTVKLDGKTMKQAHRKFINQKKQEHPGTEFDDVVESNWVINDLSEWLENQVDGIDATTEEGLLRKAIAGSLTDSVQIMKGYTINGFKFNVLERDKKLKTQNSGVMVEADGQTYYGRLTDICEVDYDNSFKVVLFRCQWADLKKGVKEFSNGGKAVNFSKLMHTGQKLQDDPFVFSSQAKQVFYLEDELHKGWVHVVENKSKNTYDLGIVDDA